MGLYAWNIAMSYGNPWRDGRRLLHEFLNPRAVTNFDDYQRKHAYRLPLQLVESPENLSDHVEL